MAFTSAPDSAFREASKHREEQRRASLGKAGIHVSPDGQEVKNKRFDPAEAKITDRLKNRTGADRPHQSKKNKNKLGALHIIIIPHTADLHAGKVIRPNRQMIETLSLSQNNYVHRYQLRDPGSYAEVELVLKELYDLHVKPRLDGWTKTNGEPLDDDDPMPLQICKLIAPLKSGPSSKLQPSDLLKKERPNYGILKSLFNRAQPSKVPVSEMSVCLYVGLPTDYPDLPFDNPHAKVTKEPNAKRQSRKRARSHSRSRSRSKSPVTRAQKKRRASESEDENLNRTSPKHARSSDDECEEDKPAAKKAKSGNENQETEEKGLNTPTDIVALMRTMINLSSPYLTSRSAFSGGYGGSGKWSTTALTPPYDKFSAIIGQAKTLFNMIKTTTVFQSDPAAAEQLLTENQDFVDAFAPFNIEARRIREDLNCPPEENLSFVKLFRLGSQGFELAVEAIRLMSVVTVHISRLPNLPRSSLSNLRDHHMNLGVIASNLRVMVEYFQRHVPGAYWYPLNGYRQLASVLEMNPAPVLQHVFPTPNGSVFHTGLLTLRDLLESPESTAETIEIHIAEFAGHASDASKMYITVIGGGSFGLKLLMTIARLVIVTLPEGPHYHAINKVMGSFCMGVAWKLFHFLQFPKCYKQARPSHVPAAEASINRATGNEEPLASCKQEDSRIPVCKDGPDETWFQDYLAPNTFTTCTFGFAPAPPPPSSIVPPESDILIRAQKFSKASMAWPDMIRDLKTFLHPNTEMRAGFEMGLKIDSGTHTTQVMRRKQWRAAQLAFHPDKNLDKTIHCGVEWEQVCTLLSTGINKCYMRYQ
ncbi:hypothetical protein BDZ89DRAFT_1063634 [Hymenopellis radicata]|nr:hypothetical protein BDZ89DRAFT_1063634 [Hymenopellis radicata]